MRRKWRRFRELETNYRQKWRAGGSVDALRNDLEHQYQILLNQADRIVKLYRHQFSTTAKGYVRQFVWQGIGGSAGALALTFLLFLNVHTSLRALEEHARNVIGRQTSEPFTLDFEVDGSREIALLSRAFEQLTRYLELFRQSFQQAATAMYITDLDGTIEEANDELTRLTGYSRRELIGEEPSIFKSGEQNREFYQELWETIRSGESWQGEIVNETRGGERFHVRETITPLIDGDGAVRRFLSVNMDITELKQAQKELRNSERQFRNVIERTPDGFVMFNRDFTECIHANDAYLEIMGLTESELDDRTGAILDPIHPDDHEMVQSHIHRLQTGESVDTEYQLNTAGSSSRWIWAMAFPILDDQEDVWRIASFIREITDRKKMEEQLKHTALHDELTQLPNRKLLIDRIDQNLREQSRDRNFQFAVIFLDVDGFKAINDTYGHEVGDEFLRSIARRLEDRLRPGDTVARFGGDEFVLLVPGLEERVLDEVIHRVQRVFRQPVSIEGQDLTASVSVGVVISDTGEKTPNQLLRDADLAMYENKHHEEEPYQLFESTFLEDQKRIVELSQELHHALDCDELVLRYQPIIGLQTEEIVGAEALIRWDHPEKGLMLPGEFLSAAEGTELMISLGRWVDQQVCQHWNHLWETCEGDSLPFVSVNHSAYELGHSEFVPHLENCFQEISWPFPLFHLEVTEQSVAETEDVLGLQLRNLRSLGIRLCVDDFGTGYSSMVHLSEWPVHMLKIDRSFVEGIGNSKQLEALIEGMVEFADRMDLDVIAEGIERDTHYHWLRGRDCRYGQGFYFHRPLSYEELIVRINEEVSGVTP